MNTQNYFGDWSNLSAPLVDLQKINQEASEKVIRECIAFCSENTAAAIKSMQTLPRVNNPEDYVNTQMKLWSQQGQKSLEFAQNIFAIYQETMQEHFNWTEDKVNTAVKTASNKVKRSMQQAEEA